MIKKMEMVSLYPGLGRRQDGRGTVKRSPPWRQLGERNPGRGRRSVQDCWNRKEQSPPRQGSGVSEGTWLERRSERQGEARSRSPL